MSKASRQWSCKQREEAVGSMWNHKTQMNVKKRLANWKCAGLRESMRWTQGHSTEEMIQWTLNAPW